MFILDIDEEAMTKTQRELEEKFGTGKIHTCKCDVTSKHRMEGTYAMGYACKGGCHTSAAYWRIGQTNNVRMKNEWRWQRRKITPTNNANYLMMSVQSIKRAYETHLSRRISMDAKKCHSFLMRWPMRHTCDRAFVWSFDWTLIIVIYVVCVCVNFLLCQRHSLFIR